ncbi:MAG: hypothetical protein AAFY88_06350 [Acidobacteriota bacterium]
MNKSSAVGRGEPLGDIEGIGPQGLDLQRTAAQHRPQRLATYVLHDDPVDPLMMEKIVDLDDIGV